MHQVKDDEQGVTANTHVYDPKGSNFREMPQRCHRSFTDVGVKRNFDATTSSECFHNRTKYAKAANIWTDLRDTEKSGKSELYRHEHQLLGPGPEAQESAKEWEECEKNPGHAMFIPVYKLTRQDIPKDYQGDEELFGLIKITSDLTVRLRVLQTSPNRPDEGAFKAVSGGSRTGTGSVCQAYPNKPEGSQRSWTFDILTALHVVFDNDEARATIVDLFYDSKESLKTTMKTVKRGEVMYKTDTTDRCWLRFITCNDELGTKLEQLYDKQSLLLARLKQRYGSIDRPSELVWIASHPHGIAKHITFGEIKSKQRLERRFYEYIYNADTCPGTSGSAIWHIGCETLSCWALFRLGICDGDDKHQEMGPGPEDQDCLKAATECKKNPGHKTFIPVGELTKDCLPKEYQGDRELLEFIKVNADLTVRVRVCDTNSTRSDAEKDETITGVVRSGTGHIYCVDLIEGPCQCSGCKDKPTGSKRSWGFLVRTSKRLLDADFTSRAISADLFYDSERCRTDGRMKTVQGGERDNRDYKTGSCRLWFATCDSEMGTTLDDLISRRKTLADGLRIRYSSSKSDKIVWVVSHPHGAAKHVTFGESIANEGLEGDGYDCRHTADVCPGCCGGHVWGIHHSRLSAKVPTHLPHHSMGNDESGFNVGYF